MSDEFTNNGRSGLSKTFGLDRPVSSIASKVLLGIATPSRWVTLDLRKLDSSSEPGADLSQ